MFNRDQLSYRQGVIGYVRNSDGKYLVFQHPDWNENEWRMPGGGLRKDEGYEQALRRELSEEFGIEEVDLEKESSLIHQFEWPDDLIERYIKEGKTIYRGQQQRQFLVKYLGDLASLKTDPNEVKNYRWISNTEFKLYLNFPGQLEMANRVVAEFSEY